MIDPLIPPLHPEVKMQRGLHLSFLEEELDHDLEQERALAKLEKRRGSVASYRQRELKWMKITIPLLYKDSGDESFDD